MGPNSDFFKFTDRLHICHYRAKMPCQNATVHTPFLSCTKEEVLAIIGNIFSP